MLADGNVRFVPDANYHGPAGFSYWVADSQGAPSQTTVFITVLAVNDLPDTQGESFNGTEDTVLRIAPATLLANDSDVDTATDGQMLHIAAVGNAQNGFVSLDADGQIVFVPKSNHHGVASFQYSVSDGAGGMSIATAMVHLAAINDAPLARGEALTSDEDVALIFSAADLLSNDSDPDIATDGEALRVARVGDPYSGGDAFTISVTDGGGATTSVSINAVHAGSHIGGGGGCPIVIDLSDNGIELIRPEDSNVFMDINGDGWRDRIGWAAPTDAVLVLDGNQDGRVDIDHEVSFVDHLRGARTDLEGLAAHDSNGDGRLTAADDRWKEFGLFQDRDGNGLQDEGEFISLDAAGLRGISLTREGVPEMNAGNVVFGTSAVEWSDGRTTRAGDVMFAGDGVPLPEAAMQALAANPNIPGNASLTAAGELAQVAQMALLFNQLAALPASTFHEAPAAFIPPLAEDMVEGWVAMAVSAGASSIAAVAA